MYDAAETAFLELSSMRGQNIHLLVMYTVKGNFTQNPTASYNQPRCRLAMPQPCQLPKACSHAQARRCSTIMHSCARVKPCTKFTPCP
ncbi:hypothetical protein CYLTODRAFT_86830 [Cylindrobasidium torrendii FP15055 ss-10]|uniref:Uncharacterized protein n=1 Tax=Cylindrobasidium torrendii FP15055 ss-10 TaxID=1314674 RepID=A0A0D7BMY2_9AGAR|nr:hypothetical protein CYLTODRAFT_86830 [Cylindrobasidium torrendii FP15055 ss-10]